MKTIICLLFALSFVGYTYGQEAKSSLDTLFAQSKSKIDVDKNELRLNLAMTIFGFPEIQYERFVDDNVGLGLSVGASVESPEDMVLRSEFLSFCRVYFGKRKASGFFIEGNMAIVGEREVYDEEYYYNYSSSINQHFDESYVSFGLGASVGVKLLSKNNFVGEVYGGGGRLFGNSSTGGYGRLGVCIGKRF